MTIFFGVNYSCVPDDKIRDFVIQTCEKEWDPEDFPEHEDNLYKSAWKLEEIDLNNLKPNLTLLNSNSFQKDLKPRITKLKELFETQTPIPSLILRGKDYLIFDGYARYFVFKQKGIKKCLAYVGHKV